MRITIHKLIAYMRVNGYKVYEEPNRLNIVGIRSPQVAANSFDDELHVFYRDTFNDWKHYWYQITTDPGTYFLYNPIQVDGTAILHEGQYENVYQLGLHRKQYTALVQTGGKVTVYRDYDRDAVLDWNNSDETNITTGWYGINIHRAKPQGATKVVDKWSAGCQVFQDAAHFDEFIALCQQHRSLHGNHFTYTLIDLRALQRRMRRYFLYGSGAVMGAGLLATYILIKTGVIQTE